MTKWSEPDNEGVTRRKVGKHRLRADINGWWAVLTEEMNGTATDLVSAQAAADAAVEKLLRQADAERERDEALSTQVAATRELDRVAQARDAAIARAEKEHDHE